MNTFTTGLEAVRRSINTSPQSLEHLWQNHPLLWQQQGWSQHQLRLWLSCQPNIAISQTNTDNPEYSVAREEQEKDDLGTTILKVVDQLGGRVLLAQLKAKLPPGTLATEQMLRTTVNNHPDLTLTGPFVRRQ